MRVYIGTNCLCQFLLGLARSSLSARNDRSFLAAEISLLMKDTAFLTDNLQCANGDPMTLPECNETWSTCTRDQSQLFWRDDIRAREKGMFSFLSSHSGLTRLKEVMMSFWAPMGKARTCAANDWLVIWSQSLFDRKSHFNFEISHWFDDSDPLLRLLRSFAQIPDYSLNGSPHRRRNDRAFSLSVQVAHGIRFRELFFGSNGSLK
jgi:hypothetical protein